MADEINPTTAFGHQSSRLVGFKAFHSAFSFIENIGNYCIFLNFKSYYDLLGQLRAVSMDHGVVKRFGDSQQESAASFQFNTGLLQGGFKLVEHPFFGLQTRGIAKRVGGHGLVHFHLQKCEIIMRVFGRSFRKAVDPFLYPETKLFWRKIDLRGQYLFGSLAPEEMSVGIHRLGQSVGEQKEPIVGMQRPIFLFETDPGNCPTIGPPVASESMVLLSSFQKRPGR